MMKCECGSNVTWLPGWGWRCFKCVPVGVKGTIQPNEFNRDFEEY